MLGVGMCKLKVTPLIFLTFFSNNFFLQINNRQKNFTTKIFEQKFFFGIFLNFLIAQPPKTSILPQTNGCPINVASTEKKHHRNHQSWRTVPGKLGPFWGTNARIPSQVPDVEPKRMDVDVDMDGWIWSSELATSHDQKPPNGGLVYKGNGTPDISGKSRLVKYYNLARWIPSLKLTASLHLKMDGWNTTCSFLLGFGLFSGAKC